MEGSLTTFANPSIQNGYYQFVQTTAPTQRSSGVPLVTGDRWYKPIDNGVFETSGIWMYNGSLWLSENYLIGGGSGIHADNYSANSSSSSSPHSAYWNSSTSRFITFVETIDLYGNCASADGSNFWTINMSVIVQTIDMITSAQFPSFTPYVVNVPGVFYTRVLLNVFHSSPSRVLNWYHFAHKTGTPANLNCSSRIVLRKAHP